MEIRKTKCLAKRPDLEMAVVLKEKLPNYKDTLEVNLWQGTRKSILKACHQILL